MIKVEYLSIPGICNNLEPGYLFIYELNIRAHNGLYALLLLLGLMIFQLSRLKYTV